MLRLAASLTALAFVAAPALAQVGGAGGGRQQGGYSSGSGGSGAGSGFGSGAGGGGSLSGAGGGTGQATGGAGGAGGGLGGAGGGTGGTRAGGAAGGGAGGGAGLGGQTGNVIGFGQGLQAQAPGTFLGSGAGLNTFVGGAGGQQALNAAGGTTGGFGGGGFGGANAGFGGAAGPTRSGGNRAGGSDPRLGIAVPLRIATPVPVRSPATLSQTLARRAAVLSAATALADRPAFRNLRTSADDAGVVTLSGDLPQRDRRLAAALARIEPGVTGVREAFAADVEPSPTAAPRPPAANAPLLSSFGDVAPLRVLNP